MENTNLNTVECITNYTIFSIEEGDTYLSSATEKEVIEYMNSMIDDLNASEKNEEDKQPFCTTMEDVFNCAEYYGVKVVDRNNKDNKVIIGLINQALKFNHSWIGETKRKDHEGYFKFSIKPLYIDDTDYIIQVVCNLMCPSGISDNGIKYVEQFTLNKYMFKDINYLCKMLICWTVRSIKYNNTIKYIQF